MEALLGSLRALGAGRLAALAAVAVATLGLLALLALRGPGTHMALLYGDLDLREAGQIAEALDRQKIPHQLGAGGAQILVPDDMVARARLALAREGLPSGGSIGYEIFDRADNLTASAFQQAMNQTRALEGELHQRRFGDAVRLEVSDECPAQMTRQPRVSVSAPRSRRNRSMSEMSSVPEGSPSRFKRWLSAIGLRWSPPSTTSRQARLLVRTPSE